MSMRFRYAVQDDLDSILELYRECIGTEGCTWDEGYPDRAICQRDITEERLFIMEDEGIVSAISYECSEDINGMPVWNGDDRKAVSMSRLVVRRDYRNQGLGRRMILRTMEELKEKGYKSVRYLVSPDNKRALSSYRCLQFDKVGEVDYAGVHWYAYEKSLFHTEQLITGKYSYGIWRRFIEAVEKYRLIRDGDRIAVCISGGKDSVLLAKLMQMVERNGMYNISVEYLMMNPGYKPEDMKRFLLTAELLGIELKVFDTDVYADTDSINGNPCFFCARMRRGYLYRKAKELGCNKIALGHHYNDVIETILMGMLYGSQVQTMLPRLESDNVEGMELIRPMYLVREQDIRDWSMATGYSYVKCACGIRNDGEQEDTTRLKIKNLIRDLANDNPAVEANIFGSVMNVDVNKIMSYKINGKTYSVLDNEQTD